MSKDYNDALERAIRKSKEFLKRSNDVQTGKIKPPAAYKTQKQIEAWKRGYINRYAKTEKIVEKMSEEMRLANISVRSRIRKTMIRMYGDESKAVLNILDKNGRYNMVAPKDSQIRALLNKRSKSFDKVAFSNMSDASAVRQRLRDELAAGIQNNESTEKLIGRIRKVADVSEGRATTILRTEMTRVQGQAQMDVCQEYYELTGIKPKKRWHCTFHNSRDSHIALNMVTIDFDEAFGNGLMYPGDPDAPASEIVNCQCFLEVIADGD